MDLLGGRARQAAELEQGALPVGGGAPGHQPDRDAAHRVPERVQRRDAQVGQQDRRGEAEPAAAPLAEQHAAEQCRPQDVPDRGQDAAQDLGLHQVAQREPVGGEYGVEGVPGALEGGEAGADGGAQHQAVPQAAHP